MAAALVPSVLQGGQGGALAMKPGPALVFYSALIASGELAAAYLPGPTGEHPSTQGLLVGMVFHMTTLLLLVVHGARVQAAHRGLSRILTALGAVPLIRIFSLGLPFPGLPMVQWLFLISLPLLLVPLSLARLLGMDRGTLGFGHLTPTDLLLQALVAGAGIPLGFVEFAILRPEVPWIPSLAPEHFFPAALAVSLSSGLAEELIFRGILLRQFLGVLPPQTSLLLVTGLFTVMHLGFLSPLDLAFVFAVGLLLAMVVLNTGRLHGVVACHSLANVTLYLVAPFLF